MADGASEWLRMAALTSVAEDALTMFQYLCFTDSFHVSESDPVLVELAQLIARRKQPAEAGRFVDALSESLDEPRRDELLLAFARTSSWARRFLIRDPSDHDLGQTPTVSRTESSGRRLA